MSRGKKIRKLRKELKEARIKTVLNKYILLNIDYYKKINHFVEDYTTIENITKALADIDHIPNLIATAEKILFKKIRSYQVADALREIIRGKSNPKFTAWLINEKY